MVDTTVVFGRTGNPVLADRLPRGVVRELILIGAVVAFTALMAQLVIPLPGSPVPVTGQTLAVLLSAAAVGPLRGVVGQAVYVFVGVAGLPVFASQAHGYHVLVGATGGYLIGFVLVSALVGFAARRGLDRRPIYFCAVFVVATALIYVPGVTWLAYAGHMSAGAAISFGLTPFLVGDALKAVVAAALLPTAWRLVAHSGGSDR